MESSRLGIKPCFRVEPKAKMWSLAAGKLPVVKKSPRSEMNWGQLVLHASQHVRAIGGETHHISTPTSRPSSSEEWQPSRQTRNSLARVDTGTSDQSVHLNRAKRKVVHKSVSSRDELGALLDDRFA